MSQTKAELINAKGDAIFDTDTLVVDSANNRVGIGTTSPNALFDCRGDSRFGALSRFAITESGGDPTIGGTSGSNFLGFTVNGTTRATLTSTGLGIGSTAPATQFAVQNASTSLGVEVDTTSGFASGPTLRGYYRAGSAYTTLGLTGSQVAFGINDVEKARLDASGRFLVGTSSARATINIRDQTDLTPSVQFEGNALNSRATGLSIINYSANSYGASLTIGASKSDTKGTNTLVVDGGDLGTINFVGADGTRFLSGASIHATADGTTGLGDMPCRLVFSTTADAASTPTERMRIDSSGNVGIGTTSPSNALDVNGVIATNSAFYAYNATNDGLGIWYNPAAAGVNQLTARLGGSDRLTIDSSGRLLVGTSTAPTGSSTTYAKLVVRGNTATSGESYLVLGRNSAASADQPLGSIWFADNADGQFARIEALCDGTPGAGDFPGRLTFSVTGDGSASPTERARLAYTGEWLVYSSGNDTLVAGNAAGSGTAQSLFTGVHTRTATTGGGTVAYRIYNNGTTFSVSDERQKKNIESTRDGYLEDIQQLRVVKYNWVDQPDDQPKELGLIAQEVASVFPGLVQLADPADPESTLGIKQSVFSFMLIKALQEAAAKIETLEAKVAALEGV